MEFLKLPIEIRTVAQHQYQDFTIIPNSWYENITREYRGSSVPDHVACYVLAYVVSWYSPAPILDPISNFITGYKKRFEKDAPKILNSHIEKRFGFTIEEISKAWKKLEQIGVIRIELRTETNNGYKYSNQRYVFLIVEKWLKISTPYPRTTGMGTRELRVPIPVVHGYPYPRTTEDSNRTIYNSNSNSNSSKIENFEKKELPFDSEYLYDVAANEASKTPPPTPAPLISDEKKKEWIKELRICEIQKELICRKNKIIQSEIDKIEENGKSIFYNLVWCFGVEEKEKQIRDKKHFLNSFYLFAQKYISNIREKNESKTRLIKASSYKNAAKNRSRIDYTLDY